MQKISQNIPELRGITRIINRKNGSAVLETFQFRDGQEYTARRETTRQRQRTATVAAQEEADLTHAALLIQCRWRGKLARKTVMVPPVETKTRVEHGSGGARGHGPDESSTAQAPPVPPSPKIQREMMARLSEGEPCTPRSAAAAAAAAAAQRLDFEGNDTEESTDEHLPPPWVGVGPRTHPESVQFRGGHGPRWPDAPPGSSDRLAGRRDSPGKVLPAHGRGWRPGSAPPARGGLGSAAAAPTGMTSRSMVAASSLDRGGSGDDSFEDSSSTDAHDQIRAEFHGIRRRLLQGV
eukprot:SAG22_NODE_491_length_9827_cov_6.501028_6_plen_294_part_00